MCVLAVRYGGEHKAPELQKEAVYGLTELHREEVRSARLVANPGCYPTSVQLPLCPLLEVHPLSFSYSLPPAMSVSFNDKRAGLVAALLLVSNVCVEVLCKCSQMGVCAAGGPD